MPFRQITSGTSRNIFVGSLADFQAAEDWLESTPETIAVIHAAKEPYHREFLGYVGRGAPKDNPEYLFAERASGITGPLPRLAMNFIDAPRAEFIQRPMIDAAYAFADEHRAAGRDIYIHCNEGRSRAPALGFILLVRDGLTVGQSFDHAWEWYVANRYPDAAPATGVWDWLHDEYRRLA